MPLKSRTWFTVPPRGHRRFVYRTSDLDPFYQGRGPYYRFSLHYSVATDHRGEAICHTPSFRLD